MENQSMSFQQHNSRDMEKPFSIRNYAFMSRQKNIAQSWPFQQKYLKLCLNHGINDVLPPIGNRADFSLNEKETSDFRRKQGEVDYSSLQETVTHLCEKLSRLSLLFDGDSFVSNQISKPQNNTLNKGAKMKGRTKKKSMAEILAVAKHCVLDSHGRIYVSGGGSSASQARNVQVQIERKVKDLTEKAPDATEDCSLIKKHQRRDDSVTGSVQFSKRSRTLGVSSYGYNECKLRPWGRKNSCKIDETEKEPGGYGKAEARAKGGNKLFNVSSQATRSPCLLRNDI